MNPIPIYIFIGIVFTIIILMTTNGFGHTTQKYFVDRLGPEGGIKLGPPKYHEGWIRKFYRRIF